MTIPSRLHNLNMDIYCLVDISKQLQYLTNNVFHNQSFDSCINARPSNIV